MEVNKEEQTTNDIKFYFDNMRAENFSDGRYGISYKDIMKNSQKIDLAYYKVMDNESLETESYFNLVRNPQGIQEMQEYADYVAENFDNFVVLGIGGSALGTRTLFSALTTMDYKKNDKRRNKRPKWFVRDSINPEKFACLLSSIDVSKTMFCVITKSGGTLETLVQLTIVIEKLKETVGDDYAKNICAITSNREGKLNKWAMENNVRTFYFDENVSGRFSVFSPVGLLPAAVVGADIQKIVDGANRMLERCHSLKFFENPALYSAALQKIALDKGHNVSYLMPYSDNLKIVAEWYCQLCAESLGKSVNTKGRAKNVGQTPVKALGTVDQHSQMQLCLEGPYDKIVTFIRVNNHKYDITIPEQHNGLLDDYIYGSTLAKVLNTSQRATEQALLECNRMNCTIEIEELNEDTIGQLLMFFMIEISFMGALLEVNTYNQPSVELIKVNIKNILSIEEKAEKTQTQEQQATQEQQTTQEEQPAEEVKQEVKQEVQEDAVLSEETEVVTELVVEPTESTFVADEEAEESAKEFLESEIQEDKQIIMPEVEKIEKVEEPVFEEEIDVQEENNFGFLQEEMEIEEPKEENLQEPTEEK